MQYVCALCDGALIQSRSTTQLYQRHDNFTCQGDTLPNANGTSLLFSPPYSLSVFILVRARLRINWAES